MCCAVEGPGEADRRAASWSATVSGSTLTSWVTPVRLVSVLGTRSLLVTGEESTAQVKLRAERIDAVADSLYLCSPKNERA